jgi:hypothetical protein
MDLAFIKIVQVTQRNDCYWLGQLKGMEWGLINEARPSDGVELYYFDGEPCEGGLTRDVIIKFLCDPQAGAGHPEDYHVLENQCHYSVNWPTSYACPTSSSKASWGLIKIFVFVFVLYTVVGCAFNVVKYGARVGLEAMPHSEFWRDLPNLVREGVTFSVNKVRTLSFESLIGAYSSCRLTTHRLVNCWARSLQATSRQQTLAAISSGDESALSREHSLK